MQRICPEPKKERKKKELLLWVQRENLENPCMLVSVCNIHTVPSYTSTADRFFFSSSQRGNWHTASETRSGALEASGQRCQLSDAGTHNFSLFFRLPWCPKYRIILIAPRRYSFSGETEAIWNKIILLLAKDTEELDRSRGLCCLPPTGGASEPHSQQETWVSPFFHLLF